MRLTFDVTKTDFLLFLRQKLAVSKIPIRPDTNGGKIHDGLRSHGCGFLQLPVAKNPPQHTDLRHVLGPAVDMSIRDGCYFPHCDYVGVLQWSMVLPARNLGTMLGCSSPTEPQLDYQFCGFLAYGGARHACPNHNAGMEGTEDEMRRCEVLRLILTRARDAVRAGLIERELS